MSDIVLKNEAFLLSRMMSSVNAVNEAVSQLEGSDFQDLRHQAIFSSMKMLYMQEKSVEPLSIISIMENHFPKQADAAYLLGLDIHSYGDQDEVQVFIDVIKKASQLAKFRNLVVNIHNSLSDESDPTQEWEKTVKSLDSIFDNSRITKTRTAADVFSPNYAESGLDYFKFIEKKMEDSRNGVRTMAGLPTGFRKLDKYTQGLCKGHFFIVGARPGVGKTTFIINLIRNLIKNEIPVGFFSLEMTAEEVVHRLTCMECGIEHDRVLNGLINPDEYREFYQAGRRIANLPLYIDEQESLSASQLIARTKRMVATYGIKCLFIDYLGEVRGDGKFASKQEEIQYVSKSLRGLAKSLRIPIVCVCQLNRMNEKEKRPPIKSDLRESGQIEADAHIIAMLHRPSLDDQNDQPNKTYLNLVKNRFGKEGSIHLSMEGSTGRMLEIDYAVTHELSTNVNDYFGMK